MPGVPFKDTTYYDFFIYETKPMLYKSVRSIRFTFSCEDNEEDLFEVMSIESTDKNSRIYQFMKTLGYKDVEGKEPDPQAFFKRGMHFKSKVITTYSEGKLGKPRNRLNFQSVTAAGKQVGDYNDEQVNWARACVGELKSRDNLAVKMRNAPKSLTFEQNCLICDLVRAGVIDLQ